MSPTNEIRFTPQRQAIWDFLKGSVAHPTADDVFQVVRKKLPKISFGTVYRNLDVLEKQGLLVALNYRKDFVRYDPIVDNHYHFVCLACDKVENIDISPLGELDKHIEQIYQHRVDWHELFFFGVCQNCK